MDIQTTFFEALLSSPKQASSRKPEEFFGAAFSPLPVHSSMPLHLVSGGIVTATFPWTFEIGKMDCFLLLHTRYGSGKLQTNGKSYSLTPSSLLLLDCSHPFRIDITADPWEYQIHFITGPLLTYYRNLLSEEHAVLFALATYSDMVMALERLPLQPPALSLSGELFICDLLNHIITASLIIANREAIPKQIPAYIRDMKELLDSRYQEPHSLDSLEDILGINKYRLCREFSAAYEMSPLQYLNKRRIEVAACLLQTTHHRIHEIGSLVGIDNTNHFIHLFKKFTNCTPSEFKQRMTK